MTGNMGCFASNKAIFITFSMFTITQTLQPATEDILQGEKMFVIICAIYMLRRVFASFVLFLVTSVLCHNIRFLLVTAGHYSSKNRASTVGL